MPARTEGRSRLRRPAGAGGEDFGENFGDISIDALSIDGEEG